MSKKSIKLDLKDKKILYELDLNARVSISNIAKKVKLTKQGVKYRIDKLFEKKIIEKTLLFVNGPKLGYVAYKFYIQLHNTNEEELSNLVKEFVKHPFIVWVATCEGTYDIAIAPVAKNNVEAHNLLNEITTKHSKYIKEITPLNYIDVSHLKKTYLIKRKRTNLTSPYWGSEPKEHPLDNYEIKILTLLCEDARKNVAEIARELNCSVDKITTRIKRLEKQKIIEGSTIILNKELMKITYYKVLLNMRFFSKEEENQFNTYVKSTEQVMDVIQMMGPWNYELDIEVKNVYEFHKIMLQLRNKFTKNIISHNSILILKEHKLNFFPMGELFKKTF